MRHKIHCMFNATLRATEHLRLAKNINISYPWRWKMIALWLKISIWKGSHAAPLFIYVNTSLYATLAYVLKRIYLLCAYVHSWTKLWTGTQNTIAEVGFGEYTVIRLF